jgi:prevent-host-death family protein
VGYVSIRNLQTNAGGVVDEVAQSGRPAVVTRNGVPMVVVVPLDESWIEDWVLSHRPEFAVTFDQVEQAAAGGDFGTSHRDLMAALGREEAGA